MKPPLLPNQGIHGSSIIVLDSVPSTNTWCKENISSLRHGDVVLALTQTSGRGRFKRKWFSTKNGSLTMSAVIDADKFPNPACIGQIAAIAVARFLKKLGIETNLKWPNDVMAGNRKISGILMENAPDGLIIVGIGININISRSAFAGNGLGKIATSVLAESGRKYECRKLVPALLKSLEKELAGYEKTGQQYIIDRWSENDFLNGKDIKVSQTGKTIKGRYAGISPNGFLLLETGSGNPQEITSGDISVRYKI